MPSKAVKWTFAFIILGAFVAGFFYLNSDSESVKNASKIYLAVIVFCLIAFYGMMKLKLIKT